jgi:hypothetical protein
MFPLDYLHQDLRHHIGTKTRYRSVLTHASCGGATSESRIDTVACNRFACPIDCKLSGWPGFPACTQSCGTGSQYRTRSVLAPAADERFKDTQKKAKKTQAL